MIEKKLSEWLKRSGYECFKDYPLGGKFPDVIAVRGSSITAFEIKKHVSELAQAIGQCLFYLREATSAYVVMPSEEVKLLSSLSFDTLRGCGIGLITIKQYVESQDVENKHDVEVFIEAKEFHKNALPLIERLRREKAVTRKRKGARERIIEILGTHPEGLSMSEISKYSALNRQTATKYIYGLVGEDLICQKSSGTSKLCYLKEKLK
jgi:predicted transcriptional regulator